MSKYDGHTPGPWEWYSSNSHIRLGTSKSYNEILYAEGHKDGVGSILLSNLVDGRLIADAPDLLAENEQLEAQLAEARESVREAYEVYAGSEDFQPETAPEAYQQRLLKQMAGILAKGVKNE